MKTNIQAAYITSIDSLEIQGHNTMEKTGNSLSKNNATENHINRNLISAQSLFQYNPFERKPNSISPLILPVWLVYLLLQSSYVAWFLRFWILEACRTSGEAIEHLEPANYIERLVYCVPIPPGADNAGRTNLRILKTSSTSCVLLCLWSFKGFESRKPHCTRGLWK